jgi:hypothetical protein
MKEILSCVKYKTHQWHICGDLKVIAILMGLQKAYTKVCYFLREWEIHASVHYSKNWSLHKLRTPGTKSVAH